MEMNWGVMNWHMVDMAVASIEAKSAVAVPASLALSPSAAGGSSPGSIADQTCSDER
jgi:hypothetical protein